MPYARSKICSVSLAIGAFVSTGGPAQATETSGSLVLEPTESGPSFGYEGNIGPEFWADLDPDWVTCGSGRSQSPIDIVADSVPRQDIPDIEFDYGPTMINTVNNGHTVQFNYDPGSRIHFGSRQFDLLQFHFHSPSEHTFEGGAQFDAEMHLVHRNANGRLAVVAVMIEEGEENPAIADTRFLGQILPRAEGVNYAINEMIDVEALLPDDRRAYIFFGSLTTPPCSEGVLWMVLRQPIEASREQIGTLNEVLDNLEFASSAGTNNRPTQPLNERRIVLDSD